MKRKLAIFYKLFYNQIRKLVSFPSRPNLAGALTGTAAIVCGACGSDASFDNSLHCTGNQTGCGGICTDTDTDGYNCGSCGIRCAMPGQCMNGTCICDNNLSACGYQCIDLMTDLDHCGSCNRKCDGFGANCHDGFCFSTFSICSVRTSYFDCLTATCHDWKDYNLVNKVPATTVFECLNQWPAPPTVMTVFFDYSASADPGCWEPPYFRIRVGPESRVFKFTCQSKGKDFMQIQIPYDVDINEIYFDDYCGDWGSSIRITAITFL